MARPSHHANDTRSSFKNPWPSAQPPSWSELAQGGFPLAWAHPNLRAHPHARDVKIVKPDWGRDSDSADPVREGKGKGKDIIGTWLGHACAFVEMPWTGKAADGNEETVKLLFDPIFSSRAGPTQFTGPSRITPAPCQVGDLPGCDAVFISHNHYDHLDLSTIQTLLKVFPSTHFFVPLGLKSWFTSIGVPEAQVDELDWWAEVDLTSKDFGKVAPDAVPETRSAISKLRITCVPAQHNSGRGARDQGSTLWCGWVLEHLVTSEPGKGEIAAMKRVTRMGSLFFAGTVTLAIGDTAIVRKSVPPSKVRNLLLLVWIVLLTSRAEIGAKFGPFDLSFIPIWRGGTLGFISWTGLRLSHETVPSNYHGTPSDAVSIHLDVKSKNSIGIHFGTFIGAEAESLEAVIGLKEACEDAGLRDLDDGGEGPHGRMGVLDQGKSWRVKVEELIVF
ncbi:N-acyl-phosphatidylethanolamine-hydrolyzing phospholipase D, partial [Phenoliferia sp. Uapishka_3]